MNLYDKGESTGMEIEVQWQPTQATGNAAWDKLLKEARANRTDTASDYSVLEASAPTSKPTRSPGGESPARPVFTGSPFWAVDGSPLARVRRVASSRAPTRNRSRRSDPNDHIPLNSLLDDLTKLAEEARATTYVKSNLSRDTENSHAATDTLTDVPTQSAHFNSVRDVKGKGKGKAYVLPPVTGMSMEVSVGNIGQGSGNSSVNMDRPASRSSAALYSPRSRSASTSSHHAPVASSSRKLQRYSSYPNSSSMFSSSPTQLLDIPTQPLYPRRDPPVNDVHRQPQPLMRSTTVAPPPKPTVRMHPLLVQQSQAQAQGGRPTSSTSTYSRVPSTSSSRPFSRVPSNSSTRSYLDIPPTSSTRPPAVGPHRVPAHSSSTSNIRAPSLGMRRTRTYPSTPFQHHSTGVTPSQKLPTRQRSFRPPLGGTATQRRPADPERLKAIEQGIREAQASSQQLVYSQIQHQPPQAPAGSQGSTASCESYTSNRSKSRNSTSTANTSVEEVPPVRVMKKEVEHRAECEEEDDDMDADIPRDGTDPDSSFGEISFDMDVTALEETMKMYD
ncbi:hypothetical protein BDQ17DRAFT_1364931 [Cyathus striatus]|nr:hypothetical protein BDQ17DRAFT_1364931 [Cyathus striatus]